MFKVIHIVLCLYCCKTGWGSFSFGVPYE